MFFLEGYLTQRTLFCSCSNIRENSIASLKNAVAAGADIVEFDVQISKDLVPVIYHNFELVTTVAKRKGGGTEYITMPLKNLTLAQLQALKVRELGTLISVIGF